MDSFIVLSTSRLFSQKYENSIKILKIPNWCHISWVALQIVELGLQRVKDMIFQRFEVNSVWNITILNYPYEKPCGILSEHL
jgi:hypothetical protein